MARARKAISTRRRFEIFKRDEFTCQYCGEHPPTVVLHVDHIVAVANGGSNEDDNLITACATCNQGKSNVPLTVHPPTLAEQAAAVAESEAQIRGYAAVMAARRQRIEDDTWSVAAVFIDQFSPRERSIPKDYLRTIKRFVERLGVSQCIEFAELGVGRIPSSEEKAFAYFCGCCWRLIKGDHRHGRFAERT